MMTRDEIAPLAVAYVETAQSECMEWGFSDCTAWPARWIESIHGRTVERPTWRTREEAHALIHEAGGLLPLWDEVLDRFGLMTCHGAPLIGDVGIIDTHLAGPVGGIFLEHGLFGWRGEPFNTRLLRPAPRTIVKVWSLL